MQTIEGKRHDPEFGIRLASIGRIKAEIVTAAKALRFEESMPAERRNLLRCAGLDGRLNGLTWALGEILDTDWHRIKRDALDDRSELRRAEADAIAREDLAHACAAGEETGLGYDPDSPSGRMAEHTGHLDWLDDVGTEGVCEDCGSAEHLRFDRDARVLCEPCDISRHGSTR